MKSVICLLALVCSISTVSSGCVKFKHITPSDAVYIAVTISNLTTDAHDEVDRNDYHRFQINSFTGLDLRIDSTYYTENIALTYDDIFPFTDSSVCKAVEAESRGGDCSDGGCCVVTLNAYCIYDEVDYRSYVAMRARTNIRNANGIHEFWTCEQEFHGTHTTDEVQTTTEDVPLVEGYDCYEYGIVYLGSTIQHWENVTTPDACQIKCQGETLCTVWIFSHADYLCLVKEAKFAVHEATGIISGPRYCPGNQTTTEAQTTSTTEYFTVMVRGGSGSDECANDRDCHSLASCMNEYGYLSCYCNAGYIGDGISSCTGDVECGDVYCSSVDHYCAYLWTTMTYYCADKMSPGSTCASHDQCTNDSCFKRKCL